MKHIVVHTKEKHLVYDGKTYPCAIGDRSVSADDKKEGDKATPTGLYPLRRVWYRADRVEKIDTALPLIKITPSSGWCDDPKDPNYNKPVTLPYPASHEEMSRDDEIYNIVIEIGYNDAPAIPGKGSAIFMHIARPTYSATRGCVAVYQEHILEILKTCTTETLIEII